jgi:MFS family permease
VNVATGTSVSTTSVPWYRRLDRKSWYTLVAANLGWLFDGYETYALILTIGVALHQLLAPSEFKAIPFYAGLTLALTLFGWGVGGIIGGILADYIGRKKMMIIAILSYALVTGLTAIAWSWTSFVVLRFLVGVAIGSEWSTGTSMMAEIWPNGTRGKGAGLMQCGLGIGFFLASAIWLVVGPTGPAAWRIMFLIGVIPALVTLWIRRGIEEPEMWKAASLRRQREKERFTLNQLLADRTLRARTLFALAMSLTTTLAWWGISTWVPPYVGSLAVKAGLNGPQWAALAGITYNIGAIAGYIGLGFFADKWGRKPVTITFFAMSLILTPVLFLWTHDLGLVLFVAAVNGFFSLGQYTWMSTWTPELYPTAVRATGVSFVFNVPRFIACFGPIAAGSLIVRFGGYGDAATIVASIYVLGLVCAPFLPETNGKPLPE